MGDDLILLVLPVRQTVRQITGVLQVESELKRATLSYTQVAVT